MMYAIIDKDLIAGQRSSAASDTVPLPGEYRGFPLDRLRFDGTSIIDGATIGRWKIETVNGDAFLRLPSMHPGSGWPEIECAWDDVLVSDGNGGWRVETDEDALAAARDRAKALVVKRADAIIGRFLKSYPYFEEQTFKLQEEEAQAVRAGTMAASDATFLLDLVQGDETRVAAEAERILANATFFRKVSATGIVMRKDAFAAIDAAESQAQIDAILPGMEEAAEAAFQQFAALADANANANAND